MMSATGPLLHGTVMSELIYPRASTHMAKFK